MSDWTQAEGADFWSTLMPEAVANHHEQVCHLLVHMPDPSSVGVPFSNIQLPTAPSTVGGELARQRARPPLDRTGLWGPSSVRAGA